MLHSFMPRTLIVRKLLVGSLSLAMLATPSVTQACWLTDWLRPNWLLPKPRTTYYQPQYASYAPASTCTTTCTKRVCNYVPQTCYRTVRYNVPVTTYRPVTTVDPCSGCRTTCWRPTTSYVQQVRRVPYTTYRQVCQNVVMRPVVTTMPSCGSGCGTNYTMSAAPGYSSCSSGMVTGGLPATQGLLAPALGSPSTSGGVTPDTYYNSQQPETTKERSVEKPVQPEKKETSKGPEFPKKATFAPPANQPTWKHRTASAAQQRSWSYTTVSWPVRRASHTTHTTLATSDRHQTELDDSGWVSVDQ